MNQLLSVSRIHSSLDSFANTARTIFPKDSTGKANREVLSQTTLKWLEAITLNKSGQRETPNLLHALENLAKNWASGGSLLNAFQALVPKEKKALHQAIGDSTLQKIFYLSTIQDNNLFWHQSFLLAQDLLTQKQGSSGLAILSGIFNHTEAPQEVRTKAQDKFQKMTNPKSVGAKLEQSSKAFLNHYLQPAEFGAIFVGSLVSGLARTAFLHRFKQMAPMAYSRSSGAFAMSRLGALTVEIPSFVVATKGIHQLMGHRQDWSMQALGNEFLDGLLILGGLHALHPGRYRSLLKSERAGMLLKTPSLGKRVGGAVWNSARAISGVTLGHKMGQWMGIRPEQSGGSTLLDSALLAIHLKMGGHLAEKALGRIPSFSAWRNKVENFHLHGKYGPFELVFAKPGISGKKPQTNSPKPMLMRSDSKTPSVKPEGSSTSPKDLKK